MGIIPLFAQTQVQILKADELMGDQTELGEVNKLIHNVELKTEDLHIFADSAYQYLEVDLVEAFGNIEIITENQLIWTDYVRYNTATDDTYFRGRVIIKSDAATIYSTEADYDFFFEIATFPVPVRLEDDDGILMAREGVYYNQPDSAAFRGNVQVTDAAQYAEADSMFTIRKAQYYELHGRVFLDDTENRARMRGDFSMSDSTGFREVRGNARLQRINEAETDTTYMIAERLEVFDRDTLNVVDAFDNVSIWSERHASLSDTARYDDDQELSILRGNARLWRRDLQLTGPVIEIQLDDDEIDHLVSYTRPFAVFPDSVTGRLNQIEGDSLWIWFEHGELYQMDVKPDAEMVYHARDEQDEPEFAIQLTAQSITMYFEGGDIDSMRILEGIEGQYIPEAQNPADIRLDGFEYDPELRPQRPEAWLEPRLPPVPVHPPFELPRRFEKHLRENNLWDDEIHGTIVPFPEFEDGDDDEETAELPDNGEPDDPEFIPIPETPDTSELEPETEFEEEDDENEEEQDRD